MSKILIVDDDTGVRRFLVHVLTAAGHECLEAENGLLALRLIKTSSVDIILSDLRMPVMNGLLLLRHAKEIAPHIPFILLTAYASPETTTEAVEHGVFDYLDKPFSPEELRCVIKRAAEAGADCTRALDRYEGNNPVIKKCLLAVRHTTSSDLVSRTPRTQRTSGV